jgi:GNAT superfamily N-acetyltransferase
MPRTPARPVLVAAVDCQRPAWPCQAVGMIVRLADEHDFPGFLVLAAQVECWFGPMVQDATFHDAVRKHIRRSAALVAISPGSELLGGLLFGTEAPVYHARWLVVSDQARGQGVGRALMDDAMARWVRGPATVEVVTFGTDHPGAVRSGARAFYERLGFAPAEAADPGPEGGSRQVYRLPVGR